MFSSPVELFHSLTKTLGKFIQNLQDHIVRFITFELLLRELNQIWTKDILICNLANQKYYFHCEELRMDHIHTIFILSFIYILYLH